MNQKIKKWIQTLLMIILLLAMGIGLYSVTVYKSSFPEYSTYNAKETGIKALYLLTRRMGYRVQRYHYPARFLQDQAVMVVYRPDIGLMGEQEEQEGLKNWLEKGNTLVLIPDEGSLSALWIFDMISEHKQSYTVMNVGDITITSYQLDKGMVCIMDGAESFVNANLKESDAAVAFIRTLEAIRNPGITFNEYYQYMGKPAPGIWELIGSAGQLMLIQLFIALLLVILRGWKTFGRVRGERELIKRPENEAQKALAGLYLRMRAYPLTLSNYYGYFTQKYVGFLNTPGPFQEKALRTLKVCRYFIEGGRGSKKELRTLVHKLEKIEDAIRERFSPHS